MQVQGDVRKMQATLKDPVQYTLPIGEHSVDMNALIGQVLNLRYLGEIHCIHCGRKTSKSFNQGYCFPCMQSLAECDSCLVKPELCHYHEGTCREPTWGETHCFQDHYVYLANTSGLKVGITRQTNLPARWLDQGASQALAIYKVRDRLTSGLVEVILKQHVADKTAWQRMLKGVPESIDMIHAREQLHHVCQQEIADVVANHGDDAVQFLAQDQSIDIHFPVTRYPEKVKALNLDKTAEISGTLLGIKGQYLIFDIGVLNIRKFAGYHLSLHTQD